jgi:hypothetical protein
MGPALGAPGALFYLVRTITLWRRIMRPLILVLSAGIALSPLAAVAAPAHAAAAAPRAVGGVAGDARCLMTMAALTSNPDPTRARTAQVGVIFFAGRIKAQEPGYDFGTRLKTVVSGMTRETLTADAQRCGPILVETLRELDAAQKTFPQPKPAAPAAGAPAPIQTPGAAPKP